MPLYFKIALKYLFHTKSRLLSFMSIISIIGITLGVSALIITMAVMSGFMYGIKTKLLETAPHIMILKIDNSFNTQDYNDIEKKLKNISDVLDYQPFIYSQGIANYKSNMIPVYVRGIDSVKDKYFMALDKKLMVGKYDLEENNVIIGKDLALALGVWVGDSFNLLTPIGRKTAIGFLPKIVEVKVVGIVEFGIYEYDSTFIAMDLDFAKSFFGMSDTITGIQLKIKYPLNPDLVKSKVEKYIDFPFIIKSWIDMNKSLFQALQLEKFAMFIVIALIVVVASFNISSLIATKSREKRKEIAILKTIGANRKFILKIFLIQGLIIGLIGTTSGTILGLLVVYIGDTFHLVKLNPEVYLIEYLPMKIGFLEVIAIIFSSMLICFLSSIFPAISASKEIPAEVLRYEWFSY